MNDHIFKFVAMRVWWSLTILVALSASNLAAAEARRLNLISIVTDDQAAWSIGAYGNRESRTPSIDRLAREGARFLNAFASTPVCSPSRATFLTGRYGTQVGVTDWITAKQGKAGLGLSPDSITWPKVLQQQGYRTCLWSANGIWASNRSFIRHGWASISLWARPPAASSQRIRSWK